MPGISATYYSECNGAAGQQPRRRRRAPATIPAMKKQPEPTKSNNEGAKKKKTRTPLNQEQLEDAARLKQAWLAYKANNKGVSQVWLGQVTKIGSQSSVSQYLNGEIPLNLPALLSFAKALGVAPEVISPRMAEEVSAASQLVMRTVGMTGVMAARSGQTREKQSHDLFRLPWVKHEGEATRKPFVVAAEHIEDLRHRLIYLEAEIVRDDSMARELWAGDVVLIDRGETEIEDRGVYAIEFHQTPMVKRLMRRPGGGVRILSDNPDYPLLDVLPGDLAELRVIGRAKRKFGTGGL